MQLKTIGTGSKGNCYRLSHENSNLLLDCGVSMMEIYKEFEFNLSKIDGCLTTHGHFDHCLSAKELLRSFVPVLMSRETATELCINPDIVETKIQTGLKEWKIAQFKLEHDSDNTGFLIQNKQTKQIICYITDSGFVRTAPVGVNVLIIECNYIEAMIQTEEMDARYKRVHGTHMSMERLVSYLNKIDRSCLQKIVLVHLSDTNSNEKVMIDTIHKLTGVPVFAARNGETICLDEVPF